MKYLNITSNKGIATIITVASAVILFGMLVFSVDMGYLFLTRNQLQNAADAGALAGASKLVFLLVPLGVSGSAAEVREEAINYATRHLAADRKVASGDVEVFVSVDGNAFEVDAAGRMIPAPDLSFTSAETINTFLSDFPSVMVVVRRTQETSTVPLFFAQIFGQPTAGVMAVAVARLTPLQGTCEFAPWLIRDWPPSSPINVGDQAVLKYNTQGAGREEPGWFSPVQFPPISRPECGSPETGANVYRDNIVYGSACNCIFGIGDIFSVQTGNVVGPTRQGINDLLALDTGASYDPATNTVIGSSHSDWTQSERIVKLLMFDNGLILDSNTHEIAASKLASFFIQGLSGTANQAVVTGYFVGITTSGGTPAQPGTPSFISAPQLIR